MVGYDPNKVNLTTKEQAYVSGATSIITRLLIQPLDVVKIRYQVCLAFIAFFKNLNSFKKQKNLRYNMNRSLKNLYHRNINL